MKIAILGAGAMGSLYASFLAGKQDVTLVDTYRPQVEKIHADGLTKVEQDKSEMHIAVKAVMSGTDIGIQDLVIVFVKGMNTRAAMQENRALLGPNTIVMTLQNGAGNNRDIAKFVPQKQIIVGTSSHNSVSLELGKFFHSGCGPTNIGPDLPGEESMRKVNEIAGILRECGLEVNVVEDIQKVLWQKLFVNCGINALTTVMQCRIGQIAENPYLLDLSRKIVYECVLVAEADGTYFDRREAWDTVCSIIQNDAAGFASMYQDRQHHRKTEIDRINGMIVRLGQEYGIDTPYNRMLVAEIHAVEQLYQPLP